MKKITIFTQHLGYGGVTNSISTLANILSEKYNVEIISTYKLYSEPAFLLKENVNVKYLIEHLKPNKKDIKHFKDNKKYLLYIKEIYISIKLAILIRILNIREIKRLDSDIVISTRVMHNNLISKYSKKNIKKIAWSHRHHNNNQKNINKLVKSCDNMDYLVSVSNELQQFYKELIGDKSVCIINSIDKIPRKISKLTENNILFLGRLAPEKGLEDLLTIFKEVNKKHKDWKLNIIGDGMQRQLLKEKQESLGLSQSVVFHGYREKAYIEEIAQNSSIYLMTSFTESFGLSLIEAMSFAIPCIAFDSAQGANEIIEDNVTGFLVPNRDIDLYVEKVNELIENDVLRRKMGKFARKESLLYSPEDALAKWEKLFRVKR